MFRTMIKAKIHRATVTQADLNYVGSLTIDVNLMEMCDILPNEQVHVLNVDQRRAHDHLRHRRRARFGRDVSERRRPRGTGKRAIL